MTSDPGDTGRPEEPAAEHPEPPAGAAGGSEEAAEPPPAGAAGGSEEAAEPPPADFDPAEHPSNPDLVRPDDRPDR